MNMLRFSANYRVFRLFYHSSSKSFFFFNKTESTYNPQENEILKYQAVILESEDNC